MADKRRYMLGVPVDPVTEEDVLGFIREHVTAGTPAQIVTLNPEILMRARVDPVLHDAVHGADLVTADGAGILWALRRQRCYLPRRVGGSDLVWTVSEQASRLGHRVFLLGGEKGVAAVAAETLRAHYPDLTVAGALPGTPDPAQDVAMSSVIRESRADILFVAFGAPRQETWIRRNLASTGVSVAIGVGGSLDYLAGTAVRAPRWMQEHGFEWLWRLLRQPRRWRRMLALPHFVWLVLRQRESD